MRLDCSWVLCFLAHGALSALVAVLLTRREASAQGETTSAIVRQVADSSDAVIPAAIVTISNRDTGLRRTVKSDQAELGGHSPSILHVEVEIKKIEWFVRRGREGLYGGHATP